MQSINCATYEGLDAKVVHVESTLTKGLPSFNIVGMANLSINESKERVKSALLSNEFSFPPKRITLSLSPSDIRKEGSQFDLSIALMIVLNTLEDDLSDWFVFGELGLDGKVKENLTLFPLILSLVNQGMIKKAIVPASAIEKLSKIPNIELYGVSNLQEAIELLQKTRTITPILNKVAINYPSYEIKDKHYYYIKEYEYDFKDIKGQEVAKRATLIAAAGYHNILYEGSPGCGKSMIANRIRFILPPMNSEEILEVAKLDALEAKEPMFKPHRNIRSPHHSSTLASIFGGGAQRAKIGEVGLANKGVLFLDELPHFSKNVLEALREPMQDNKIRISRVNTKVEYAADFLFVGAMNPCPCGNLLNKNKECRCSDIEIKRYKNRLSDPFLDRVDINIVMQSVNKDDKSSYTSKELHKMVVEAHLFSKERGQEVFNAKLSDSDIEKYCIHSQEAKQTLSMAIERFDLSFRAIKKVQKLGRTIADLDKCETIGKKHILEALSYRRR
ncbi:YifB family Mg chelatase-like AAA ATPase [Sulfurimonas sp.]|nr:YifB family Mg chelatase-like AAA ATPase [Sulfurimonas sp.]